MLRYETYPAPHMVAGVKRYIENGIPPGSFLTAIISNDLREACAKADDINRHLIFKTVSWFWNEAPSRCWGSPERMEGWTRYARETARSPPKPTTTVD